MDLYETQATECADDAGHFLRRPQDLVIAPHLVELLTRSPTHPTNLAGGHAVPLRAGALDFKRFPSRRGDTLYWPDGRTEPINSRGTA